MSKTVIFIAVVLAALSVSCESGFFKRKGATTPAIENILERKSVRSYTAKAVETEKIELLLRAGMAAPSAMDRRPWGLIVVDDRALLDLMAEGLPHAKMLAEAPLAIVVCGIEGLSPLWYLDCSAMAQNILLAAESLGLGAVWTAAYPYEDRVAVVASVLDLPIDVQPLCVIPVGYPKGEYKAKDKFNAARVRYNGMAPSGAR